MFFSSEDIEYFIGREAIISFLPFISLDSYPLRACKMRAFEYVSAQLILLLSSLNLAFITIEIIERSADEYKKTAQSPLSPEPTLKHDRFLYSDIKEERFVIFLKSQFALLDNLLKETYIRNIVKRNKIRNVGEMEALLDVLASAIAFIFGKLFFNHIFNF